MSYKTTAGKILLTSIFPEDMKDEVRSTVMDKAGVSKLLGRVASTHPDKYEDVLNKLNDFGINVSSTYGKRSSFSLDSFITSDEVESIQEGMRGAIEEILGLGDEGEVREGIERIMLEGRADLEEAVLRKIKGTSLESHMLSGTGKDISVFTDLLAGDVTAYDHQDNLLPYPILHGFNQGLSPWEYFLSAQKARAGLVGTKLATPDAGDISSQLSEATMRLRVTEKTEPREYDTGIPIDPQDSDYEGSFIAQNVEGIAQKGDQLTPDVVDRLRDQKIKKIMIYSPISSMVPYGISSEAAGNALGIRMPVGAFAGLEAAQAISEPFTQVAIGSKHVGQRSLSGLDVLRQLIGAPRVFSGKAAVAKRSGVVDSIKELKTGGKEMVIAGEPYFLEPGIEPIAKIGHRVKKGDIVSEGLPNPRELVDILGLGGGRYKMSQVLYNKLTELGVGHNKRIGEYLAAGLINHVRMTDEWDGHLPDDVVEYSDIARSWEPPDDSTEVEPRMAKGKYLQKPVAYHTIGTQMGAEEIKELTDLGIEKVVVSDQAPPFVPEVRWARGALSHTDDWLLNLYGSNVKRHILEKLYTGKGEADPGNPVSFISQMVLSGAPKPLGDEIEDFYKIPTLELDKMFS